MMDDAKSRVTMGCLDDASCSVRLKTLKVTDGGLLDPAELDEAGFRKVRDELRDRVAGLIQALKSWTNLDSGLGIRSSKLSSVTETGSVRLTQRGAWSDDASSSGGIVSCPWERKPIGSRRDVSWVCQRLEVARNSTST
jgi:hypothetical protein